MDNYLAEIIIILTLVVLILVISMFALARQIGVLQTRLAPTDALTITAGPKVGEPAPLLEILSLDGRLLKFGGPLELPQLLLFLSPSCPVCEELISTAKFMARSEKLSLIFGSDGGEAQRHADYVSKMGIQDYPYVVSPELGIKFDVIRLPCAVLIDEQGVLRSKGLVTNREHLETLVESI